MSICVFAGPTLPRRDTAREFNAIWLPPAQHGDVYRAVALLRPRAIGIIDGYFQWAPSVWHKEILWAIRQGVHVFGAASMGALRAAELAPFGMRGIGRIFEAYRAGVLVHCGEEPFEDDDEVAVIHGPADSDYLALSEAMVNIRYTLAEAQRAGVLDSALRTTLVALAKSMYFADRNYDALLAQARSARLPCAAVAALQAWLPGGRVNLKRLDAVALIDAMRTFLAADPPPARANFEFEHTTLWGSAVAALQPATAHESDAARVLAELRLDTVRWRVLRKAVLHNLLGTDGEAAEAEGPDAERPADTRLDRLARQTAAQRVADDVPPMLIERQILVRLRAAGDYQVLLERARDKCAYIKTRSDLPQIGDFSELQLLQLRDWYFSQLAGGDMPDDLEHFLQDTGFADAEQFHAAIFAEYVYRQRTGHSAAAGEIPVEHRQ